MAVSPAKGSESDGKAGADGTEIAPADFLRPIGLRLLGLRCVEGLDKLAGVDALGWLAVGLPGELATPGLGGGSGLPGALRLAGGAGLGAAEPSPISACSAMVTWRDNSPSRLFATSRTQSPIWLGEAGDPAASSASAICCADSHRSAGSRSKPRSTMQS